MTSILTRLIASTALVAAVGLGAAQAQTSAPAAQTAPAAKVETGTAPKSGVEKPGTAAGIGAGTAVKADAKTTDAKALDAKVGVTGKTDAGKIPTAKDKDKDKAATAKPAIPTETAKPKS